MAGDHLITPETIAREAAESLYSMTHWPELAPELRWVVLNPWGNSTAHEETQEKAEARAETLRRKHREVILGAIERFAREVPVPGGLSAERVAKVKEILGRHGGSTLDGAAIELLSLAYELFGDNAHLRRALHDCGQDGSAAQWAAGYGAGREAGMREKAAGVWLAGFHAGRAGQKHADVAAAEAAAQERAAAGPAAPEVAAAVRLADRVEPPPARES